MASSVDSIAQKALNARFLFSLDIVNHVRFFNIKCLYDTCCVYDFICISMYGPNQKSLACVFCGSNSVLMLNLPSVNYQSERGTVGGIGRDCAVFVP